MGFCRRERTIVHTRPSQRFPVRLAPTSAKLTSTATRARIAIRGLTADTFSGSYELTVFSGSPLIQAESAQGRHTGFVHRRSA